MSFLLPLGIIALWYCSSELRWVDPYLLPSPRRVLSACMELYRSGELLDNCITSIYRVAIGFASAAVIGVALGIILGMSAKLSILMNSLAQFLRQVPPVAWIPLFILWFGVDEGSKQAVIIYATVFPILVNTSLGITSVDPNLLEVGRVMCLKPFALFTGIILPSSIPSIFAGLRLGLGNSWRALVAAEMIAASSGLGYMIMEARSLSRPEGVIVGLIAIGLIGSAMDSLFVRIEKMITPWRWVRASDE
jgi:sulfonate transport system permease protein